MEVTLEEATPCGREYLQRSFNPYSNGSYSGSRLRCGLSSFEAMFQSLF